MNRIIIPTITYRYRMRDIFMPYRHLIPINDNCFRPLKMPIGTGYRKSLQFIYRP